MSTNNLPEAPRAAAAKADPEAMALRASPRPVTRLNRRTLVVLVGGLSAAVLGATLWSLSPSRRDRDANTELFNDYPISARHNSMPQLVQRHQKHQDDEPNNYS